MKLTHAEEEFRNLDFDCVVNKAVNPMTYEEVELDPPVRIQSYRDFIRFNEEWERFCRRAADRGVRMRIARFELYPSQVPVL